MRCLLNRPAASTHRAAFLALAIALMSLSAISDPIAVSGQVITPTQIIVPSVAQEEQVIIRYAYLNGGLISVETTWSGIQASAGDLVEAGGMVQWTYQNSPDSVITNTLFQTYAITKTDYYSLVVAIDVTQDGWDCSRPQLCQCSGWTPLKELRFATRTQQVDLLGFWPLGVCESDPRSIALSTLLDSNGQAVPRARAIFLPLATR